MAYGVTYTAGGHLRVLGPGGNLICDHDTNQTVDSSPAVGNFLAGGQTGIAFGTGSFYAGASDSNTLFGSRLALQHRVADEPRRQHHRAARPSATSRVTATCKVVEGADTGSGGLVWALNGRQRRGHAGLAPGHARAGSSAASSPPT